jgi:two-component system, sensor histidine kinase and response regulator
MNYRHRALVVDDDATIRLVAQRQLGRLGFEVQTASSGEEAVEIFQTFQPGLILMDIHMPEMDGIEATKIIRESEPSSAEQQAAIVIAMTASQIRQVVLEAGLDDYLFKPFLFEELREVVSKWVSLPNVESPQ